MVTVVVLIAPYIILNNVFIALTLTLTLSILIIAFYTFYMATAKNKLFWRHFLGMVAISLGVAITSFVVGTLLRKYLGIEV